MSSCCLVRCMLFILVTGDANFSMETTCLTVGGFSQPSVARSLIEQSGSAEIGLSQRFLWLFPQPSYCRFNTLEGVDKQFSDSLGEYVVFNLGPCSHLIIMYIITSYFWILYSLSTNCILNL